MGMYTELILKCDIYREIPQEVRDVLFYLFVERNEELIEKLPDHAFFKTERWDQIGSVSSYYHTPTVFNFFKDGYFFTRCDIKNYDDEIDLFLDWLDPYISNFPGYPIGWKWCEEADEPTIIYAHTNYKEKKVEKEIEEIIDEWDKYARESIVSMAKFMAEEGHLLHEYKFAESSIMNSMHYLKSKRSEE